MSDKDLLARIKHAQAEGKRICEARGRLAAVVSGLGLTEMVEVDFPDLDVMHVYALLFGRRAAAPAVYRLSVGKNLVWVGESHPWGIKLADIKISGGEQ